MSKNYFVVCIKAHQSQRNTVWMSDTHNEAEQWIYDNAKVGYTYFIERR